MHTINKPLGRALMRADKLTVLACSVFALTLGRSPYDCILWYVLATSAFDTQRGFSMLPTAAGVWLSVLAPSVSGWSILGGALAVAYTKHLCAHG